MSTCPLTEADSRYELGQETLHAQLRELSWSLVVYTLCVVFAILHLLSPERVAQVGSCPPPPSLPTLRTPLLQELLASQKRDCPACPGLTSKMTPAALPASAPSRLFQ